MSAAGKEIHQAAGHLYSEARFADPSWARDRDQAHILPQQQFFSGRYFFLSPHKRGPLHRNIGRARFRLMSRLLREMVAYGCQFARQIPGRDVALIGIFRQTSLDGPAQRSGGVEVLHSHRFGLFPQNGHQCLRRRAFLKGVLPGYHFVEHQAERELV